MSASVATRGGASRIGVAVGVLGQHALGEQPLAQLPARRAAGHHVEPGPQAADPHLGQPPVAHERRQPLAQPLPQDRRLPLVLAGHEHLHHLVADGGRERVAAERRAVGAGRDDVEHVVVGRDRRDRVETAAQRLAEHVDVGHHALVVAREGAAGPPQTRLDLVGDHEHVVLAADRPHVAQEALRRDDHAALALDRLEQHRDGRGRALSSMTARSASASPYGTRRKPGVNGPYAADASASSEKLTIVVVRPWKFPPMTMTTASSSGTPLTW